MPTCWTLFIMLKNKMKYFSYILATVVSFLVICMAFQFYHHETPLPHLVFIIADDLGWNDVGFHNKDMHTPNLNKLASDGIQLNQSYMQYMCTPSRSAFMTGYYPFRTGMQHGVIWRLASSGLPLQFKTLPEKLKDVGYATHLVGKWHLGHCHLNYTPTYRGFDTFVGPYAGASTYYSHALPGKLTAYDFHNGSERLKKFQGVHSSNVYLQQVEHILSTHEKSKPLFLYLAFSLPHSPLEVPEQYLNYYQNVKDKNRTIYSAMVSALDDDVGRVVDYLRKYELYGNSIIVFSSDNGGQVTDGGNNFPLRGNKNTFFEGGTRVVGFVHSQLLSQKGFVYDGLIHAVDWFATLLSLAGGTPDPEMDGIDVWRNIIHNLPSPRTEFIYNIDNLNSSSIDGAIRVKDWKLIFGKTGLPDGWYTPENAPYEYKPWAGEDYLLDRPGSPKFRLFNIKEDPYEQRDLARIRPDKVKELLESVEKYKSKVVLPVWTPNSAEGIKSIADGYLDADYCEPIQQVAPSESLSWPQHQ